MLRKDYIFFGIVNFSQKLPNNYKFAYRKTLKYNNQVNYEIVCHKGPLSYDELEDYIKKFNDKILVSIMKTYSNSGKSGKSGKTIKENYLIFKKSNFQEKMKYDYLLTEVVKDKYTEFSNYLKDISNKMNLFQNDESVKFNLSCVVNNDNSLFLVFYEKMDNDDTTFENEN